MKFMFSILAFTTMSYHFNAEASFCDLPEIRPEIQKQFIAEYSKKKTYIKFNDETRNTIPLIKVGGVSFGGTGVDINCNINAIKYVDINHEDVQVSYSEGGDKSGFYCSVELEFYTCYGPFGWDKIRATVKDINRKPITSFTATIKYETIVKNRKLNGQN